MSTNFPIPETKVLAIASHVVYGYVGNTMATFVMQSLGCDVAAINTVHFSNHTGYRQFRGRRHPASELDDLYSGLASAHLTDFSMLLTGYAPSAEAVSSIGRIAADLQARSSAQPGAFFWILDPVMGDQGRLYVAADVVPVYQQLISRADLILPNQFEAETLSGRPIHDWASLAAAVEHLHRHYGIPHVVVTSIAFASASASASPSGEGDNDAHIAVVGSSRTTAGAARLFAVLVPKLDCFFSGTGDMFAALMVVRLREAAIAAGLEATRSWMSADVVASTQLPLAKAVERVLASMAGVLERTMEARDGEMRLFEEREKDEEKEEDKVKGQDLGDVQARASARETERYLAMTKAAEVRVVRNVALLRDPVVIYHARKVEL